MQLCMYANPWTCMPKTMRRRFSTASPDILASGYRLDRFNVIGRLSRMYLAKAPIETVLISGKCADNFVLIPSNAIRLSLLMASRIKFPSWRKIFTLWIPPRGFHATQPYLWKRLTMWSRRTAYKVVFALQYLQSCRTYLMTFSQSSCSVRI